MARNNPQVSVIMTVYNVDTYVGRAIESLQNQTFRDFELLIVDDGSTDRSGDICDRFAKKDIRIDVFHTSNAGAPAARNLALDHARGTYVYFMDADDWAEQNMLQDMVSHASEHAAQLVVTGFTSTPTTQKIVTSTSASSSISHPQTTPTRQLLGKPPTNCLTRISCIHPGISSFCARA